MYNIKIKNMINKIKHTDMLISAINTLFFSWGSDTPDEVFWGANELLDWYETEYNITLGIRFDRDEETYETNFDDVINALLNN